MPLDNKYLINVSLFFLKYLKLILAVPNDMMDEYFFLTQLFLYFYLNYLNSLNKSQNFFLLFKKYLFF